MSESYFLFFFFFYTNNEKIVLYFFLSEFRFKYLLKFISKHFLKDMFSKNLNFFFLQI